MIVVIFGNMVGDAFLSIIVTGEFGGQSLDEMFVEKADNHYRSSTTKDTRFGLFCETRWVEKRTTLLDFDLLNKPLLSCLDAIGSLEPNWDVKTKVESYD